MTTAVVLLTRGGGTAAGDPKIADKVRSALEQAGIDAEVELVSGGECAVRCRAAADRGDPLLIVGGGDGTISRRSAVASRA